jgi:hypothetical protein
MTFRWLGAVLVTAWIVLGAGEARAQSCAIPDEVPAAVYDAYVELLAPGLPLEIPACDALAKGALSACHKAVSASTRCWKGIGKGLAKGAKTTCKEQGPDEELCFQGTGAQLANLQSNVEASEAAGHAACDADAEAFWAFCVDAP